MKSIKFVCLIASGWGREASEGIRCCHLLCSCDETLNELIYNAGSGAAEDRLFGTKADKDSCASFLDEYFMSIVELVKTRSTCLRQVGAC